MKNYLILIVSVIALVFLINACSGNTDEKGKMQTATDREQIAAHLQTIDLSIEGMTCGGCEIAVIAAVKQLDGVFEVNASHLEANARIVFDSTATDVDQMRVAIENAGYKAHDFVVIK